MVPLKLGAWLPDNPDLENPGVTVAMNVVPGAGCYKPMPSAELYCTTAMSSMPLGAVAGMDQFANAFVFAGDAGKLYTLDPSIFGWKDVSRTPAYTTAAGERWAFTEYGTQIIGTNYSDFPQVYDMNSSTKFSNLTTLVKGRHIATSRGFVILGNTYDALDSAVAYRVRWSALENSSDFNPSVQTMSDWQDIYGLGAVQAVIGGESVKILLQRGIYLMTFVGTPIIFQFDCLTEEIGCAVPESVIDIGDRVMWLSDDGFYQMVGSNQPQPIGQGQINDYFRGATNPLALNTMRVTCDPNSKLVYWLYASVNSDTPDRFIVFNYVTGMWSEGECGVPFIFNALSLPTTIEQLDRYGSVENVPASYDSNIWTGGKPYMAGIDATGKVYSFTGQNLISQVETTELAVASYLAAQDPSVRGDRSIVHSVRPLYHGQGAVKAAIGSRPTTAANVVYGPDVAVNSNGACAVRKEGRYHRCRVTLQGGWSQVMGVQLDATPAGNR